MTKEQIDAAKAKLAQRSDVVRRVLATEDGKELLKLLKKEFLFDMSKDAKEQHQIIFNAGRADVVAWLEAMNAFNPEGR